MENTWVAGTHKVAPARVISNWPFPHLPSSFAVVTSLDESELPSSLDETVSSATVSSDVFKTPSSIRLMVSMAKSPASVFLILATIVFRPLSMYTIKWSTVPSWFGRPFFTQALVVVRVTPDNEASFKSMSSPVLSNAFVVPLLLSNTKYEFDKSK